MERKVNLFRASKRDIKRNFINVYEAKLHLKEMPSNLNQSISSSVLGSLKCHLNLDSLNRTLEAVEQRAYFTNLLNTSDDKGLFVLFGIELWRMMCI